VSTPVCKALLFVHVMSFEVSLTLSRELAWWYASEARALMKEVRKR
jgi:hypothetical protein